MYKQIFHNISEFFGICTSNRRLIDKRVRNIIQKYNNNNNDTSVKKWRYGEYYIDDNPESDESTVGKEGLNIPEIYFGQNKRCVFQGVIYSHASSLSRILHTNSEIEEFIKESSICDNEYSKNIMYFRLTNLSLVRTKYGNAMIKPYITGEYIHEKLLMMDQQKILNSLFRISKEINSASPFYIVHINHVNFTDNPQCENFNRLDIKKDHYSKSLFMKQYGKNIHDFVMHLLERNKEFKLGLLLVNIPQEFITEETVRYIVKYCTTNYKNVDENMHSLLTIPQKLMTDDFIDYLQRSIIVLLDKHKTDNEFMEYKFPKYNILGEYINAEIFLKLLNCEYDIYKISNSQCIINNVIKTITTNQINSNITNLTKFLKSHDCMKILIKASNIKFNKESIENIFSDRLESYYAEDNWSQLCDGFLVTLNHTCESNECSNVRNIAKQIASQMDFFDEDLINSMIYSFWFFPILEQMTEKQKNKYGFTKDTIDKYMMYYKYCVKYKRETTNLVSLSYFTYTDFDEGFDTPVSATEFVKQYDKYKKFLN